MKSLTLKQLREAIRAVKTNKKFSRGALAELLEVEAFMLSQETDKPRDPRTVLVEIGYKW